MSNLLRLSAAAVVAVFGVSVASAQSPGLRSVPVQSGVRSVATASPVPGIVIQQQQMWDNAFRQAQLWQMYQPRVVVVNPLVTANPWGPTITSNPWGPSLYRGYTPRW